MNGFDVLRNLRAKSNVPVLMLTGRGEEADRIVGLELGADDYLPKTFSTRECWPASAPPFGVPILRARRRGPENRKSSWVNCTLTRNRVAPLLVVKPCH